MKRDFPGVKHVLLCSALAVLLLTPSLAQACIWIHGTTIDGTPKEYSSSGKASMVFYAMEDSPADRLKEVWRAKPSNPREEKENHAVGLTLAGKPLEAIPILQDLEKESPGDYSIAANLGTAYELAGDPENALVWIKEGITRNAGSHEGTEWLHALILETKIRLLKDPTYLATHRIVPLPENFSADTKVAISNAEYSVGDIEKSLLYQLGERCVFVKPPDPIVADLLFTLARITAHIGVVEGGLELLEASKKYGFADPGLLEKTKAEYEAIRHLGKIRREQARLFLNIKLAVMFAIAASVAVLYFCHRMGWLFLTPAARRKHLEKKLQAARSKIRGESSKPETEEQVSP